MSNLHNQMNMPDENRESASARPPDGPPIDPWPMTLARERKLLGLGYTKLKTPFWMHFKTSDSMFITWARAGENTKYYTEHGVLCILAGMTE